VHAVTTRPFAWHFYERAIQFADAPNPKQSECTGDVGPQDLDGARNAWSTSRPQSIGVRAADEHGLRAEAKGFHDVAAAANAAIHQHFQTTARSRDDLRQRAQTRGDPVQLPPAMV
jgi:hypothetical protein